MSTTWIRVAYGAVLGLMLFFSARSGIALPLPGPTPPQDPQITYRQLTGGDDQDSQNRLTASVDAFYNDAKDYRDNYVVYQRNTFLAGAGIAVLLALVALALPAAVNFLRWGLLLGAGLTFLWAWYVAARTVPQPAPPLGSILGLVAAGEPKPLDFVGRFLLFALSGVGLILVVFVGLWRLTEWPTTRRITAIVTPAEPASDARSRLSERNE